jgi:hypothetical protein
MNSFTPAPVLTNNPNVSASSVTSNISRFSADTVNALTNNFSKLTGATSSAVSNNMSKLSSATSSALSSESGLASVGASDGGSWFTNISVTAWLIIIMILAFLGINVFVYLAKGTQDITNFFKPLVEKIVLLFGAITSKVVNVSAGGVKGAVDTTADVLDTGLSAVQEATSDTSIPSQSVKTTIPEQDTVQNSSLNKELNTSKQTNQSNTAYEADESSSKIQSGAPKSGWCYIGEDRGFRSCAKVGANDECMSGDIFPSQEICVNPNLRA